MTVQNAHSAEIKELQEARYETRRVTVPELEEILYEPFPVLDHGFVRVIDYMGDDSSVVQAARVSYGKGTKHQRTDEGLIRYLMRHRHTTPFEMCEMKFHIKLPMFVARQWIRHRTANVNEYSARYSILDREFYIPELDKLAAQALDNRQGRGDALQGDDAVRVQRELHEHSEKSYAFYQSLLNADEAGNIIEEGKDGLSRELARMVLPVNAYTQWYWKVDLHNLLHFLSLRADRHAQYEIRAYADAMLKIVEKWMPMSFKAFMDYRVHAAHLSEKGLEVVKKMIKGETVTQEESGMSGREWGELMDILESE